MGRTILSAMLHVPVRLAFRRPATVRDSQREELAITRERAEVGGFGRLRRGAWSRLPGDEQPGDAGLMFVSDCLEHRPANGDGQCRLSVRERPA
jgi:hypothetical protein